MAVVFDVTQMKGINLHFCILWKVTLHDVHQPNFEV